MPSLFPAPSGDLFPHFWLSARSSKSLLHWWLWFKAFHWSLKKCSSAFKKLTQHPQIIQQHLGTTVYLRFSNTRPWNVSATLQVHNSQGSNDLCKWTSDFLYLKREMKTKHWNYLCIYVSHLVSCFQCWTVTLWQRLTTKSSVTITPCACLQVCSLSDGCRKEKQTLVVPLVSSDTSDKALGRYSQV